MVEDRHIEAAIRAPKDAWTLAEWTPDDVRRYLSDRDVRGTIARSILAHAETLARVEAALDAVDSYLMLKTSLPVEHVVAVKELIAALKPKDK